MFSNDIKRPNYRDGQYLGPRDFVAEQLYHRDARRRLSLGQHTWGIYTGLDLSEQPREGSTKLVDLFITPGLAIDGFGRDIVVFAPFKLEPSLFARFTVDGWVELWLSYDTEQTEPPRYGYELCDDPDFAYRTRETFRVDVGPRTAPRDPIVVSGVATPTTLIDPALPVEVSVPSVPHQELPDDDENARWMIQLGWVHWNGTDGFVAVEKSAPGAPLTDDEKKRVQGRIYGGVVAAHTYAIDDTWELVTRRPPAAPADANPPRAKGFVRGALTVEDLLVSKKSGLRMDASPIAFVDKAEKDNGWPLTLSRFDRTDSADLRVTIGNDGAGKNRLVIRSGTSERVRIKDNGDIDVTGTLHVDGIADLVSASPTASPDRLVAWRTGDDKETAALGVEGGGLVMFQRAATGMNWYIGAKNDAGASARMLLDGNRMQLRGDLTVGAFGNGRLKVRHVDGKDSTSNADDHLYLNYATGKSVIVGQQGGTPSSLIVTGNLVVGTKTFPPDPILVDVMVGSVHFSPGLNGSGTYPVSVTSRLPKVSDMSVMLALIDISNNSVATNAGWSVRVAAKTKLTDNTYTFDVAWVVGDSDGFLNAFSWMAVFIP